MPRTLDPQLHAVRRDSFVEVAQRLIQAKGYEAFSIQDVLDDLDASKGAFYHYFGSKADLLEAVVERMADAIELQWDEMLARPGLSARERLETLFTMTARWKNARRELVLGILEAWMSDDNAIVREKLRRLVARRMTRPLRAIIAQGIAEGEMTAKDPDRTALVVVTLVTGTSELAGELFVARQQGSVSYEEVERTFVAHTAALERVLGLPPGRLQLVDRETLELWFR